MMPRMKSTTILRRYRKENDLTQADLASQADLSQPYIGALERGDRTNPSPQTVERLRDGLNLSSLEHEVLKEFMLDSTSNEPGTHHSHTFDRLEKQRSTDVWVIADNLNDLLNLEARSQYELSPSSNTDYTVFTPERKTFELYRQAQHPNIAGIECKPFNYHPTTVYFDEEGNYSVSIGIGDSQSYGWTKLGFSTDESSQNLPLFINRLRHVAKLAECDQLGSDKIINSYTQNYSKITE